MTDMWGMDTNPHGVSLLMCYFFILFMFFDLGGRCGDTNGALA